VDADHLDYYRDLDDVKSAFQEFVNKLDQKDGRLIIHNAEDFLNFKNKTLIDDIEIGVDILSVPGKHNRENAKLVLGLANVLGLDTNKAKTGLGNFKGTWRRQEYKGKHFNMDWYDDYAHHPTEIAATLDAIKEKYDGKKKIIAVFMPHLYSRTKILLDEFAKCFDDADEVILLPIYAAREEMDKTVSSDILQERMLEIDEDKKVFSFASMYDTVEYLKTKNDEYVVVTMGAGDIFKIYEQL
jgi:UDP-N-acetylmuramate--alanine ligase